ncbi:MAG: alpha-galactosidase [Bryobacterales bacterium]|nr:alpha-galactosidase [Bryobacterales bacterium]
MPPKRVTRQIGAPRRLGVAVAAAFLACGPARAQPAPVRLEGREIAIEFDRLLHSRILARFGGRPAPLAEFGPSEYLRVGERDLRDFTLREVTRNRIRDELGTGQQVVLTGEAEGVRKTVRAAVYDDFPRQVFLHVEYENTGAAALPIESWTSHEYSLSPGPRPSDPPFWSFQPGSYSKRPDWILPLRPGFRQENFLGMNATDYGGGIPVADVWRRDLGLAVGHIERVPRLVSLPIEVGGDGVARLAVRQKVGRSLPTGERLATWRTFVAVHRGDHFRALRDYSRAMARRGFRLRPAPESAFMPLWCGWGYGRQFTPAQIYGALPMVKKLGFAWVTLDDGWQTSEGDWFLDPKKFPRGDADMRAMVDRFHAEGFRAQLWWAPLAADPETELLKKHREMLLLNADGSPQRITWWNAWYLCPADPAVVEYHRKLVVKFLRDWDYDGLKIDGQYLNAVPPCYNPAHRHARPEESVEALQEFFRVIYETSLGIKKDALIEICPCGTAYAFHYLPYLNMTVASDPRSSWQVRLKGKTLKALHGDEIAYFGDHVEMSDEGLDFASIVGIGGVPGSNFRWPPGSGGDRKGRGDLTPEREQQFARWLALYREKMPSRGRYLGELYDIGFDRPEGHAIRKGDTMYYAFYAPSYKGRVELRGLAARTYRVSDYVNARDLGTVRGPVGTLQVEFERHLLLEARPQ